MTEYEVREVRKGLLFRRSLGKNFVVLGYEQNFTDLEPVLVQCRYFESLEEAKQYKQFRERGESNGESKGLYSR